MGLKTILGVVGSLAFAFSCAFHIAWIYFQPRHHAFGADSAVLSEFLGVAPSATSQATVANASCALLFFGLAKRFEGVVLPSIREYILRPNPGCIVFAVHTYKVTETTNPRNDEFRASVKPEEVSLLPARRVMLDDPETSDLVHNVTLFLARDDGRGFSVTNMVRQWHSIARAWAAMEAELQAAGRSRIDRVGLFRTDVVYTTPVNLTDENPAVIPNHMADGMFYGSWEVAKVWATQRFCYVGAYLENHKGIHSETFLRSLLQHFHVPVVELPICFHRIRATGFIQKDCGEQFQYVGVVLQAYVGQRHLLFLGLFYFLPVLFLWRVSRPLHSHIAKFHNAVLTTVSFFGLVCQNSAAIFMIRYTQVKPEENQYIPATAVVMAEVLKTAVSMVIVLAEEGTLRGVVADENDVVKASGPAVLYLVQNNLQYFAMQNLDGVIYQAVYQIKLVTTALIWVFAFKKGLRKTQWVALCALSIGVYCIKLSETSASAQMQNMMNWPAGFAATLSAAITSGLAGVYIEMLLKKSKLSVWQRNVQLGVYSVIVGQMGLLIAGLGSRISKQGYFHGYTFLTWVSIVIQGMGGLLIGFLIKRLNVIWKDIATALSIFVSCILSWFLLNHSFGYLFFLGALLIVSSVTAYRFA